MQVSICSLAYNYLDNHINIVGVVDALDILSPDLLYVTLSIYLKAGGKLSIIIASEFLFGCLF